MTTMKKLVSLVLAAMMLLCTLSIASAEETTTYTVTINGADENHVFEAYQIFTGNLSGNVLTDIVLGDGVDDDILTYEGNTYTDAAALAKDLDGNIAVEAFMDHASKYLTVPAGTSTETAAPYTIKDLEPGYYLIKDKDDSVPNGDAYTKFIAKIVKDTIATPKTDKTTHEKKVYENVKFVTDGKTGLAGDKYNDVADYCIGDTVPFAFYSKVPDLTYYDHYTMVFHDQMSAGLTFQADSVKVFVGTTELDPADFVVTTGCADSCTFEVQIKELAGKGYVKGAEIRVDFNAVLNENAVIGLDGNPNQSKLQFTNNPNNTGSGTDGSDLSTESTTETPWDYVVVFTYELDVTKVDGADADKKLKDAEFVLQNKEGKYVTIDANGVVTGWVATQEEASVLKSSAEGTFKVVGLDDGTYTLTETKAPEGYNLLTKSIEIVVAATTVNDQNYAQVPADALTKLEIKVDGTGAEGNVTTGVVDTTVANNVGATLPETGGIGTTIFYVVGGVLVLAAIVLLVTKRRVGEEN